MNACTDGCERYVITLTFMYLTSISVFFSSSTITSLWNLLNCGKKQTTPTSKPLQHPSSCFRAVLNAMHSWVTWLSGDVTIRVEWPGGMCDNGFLRGWDSTHQGCLISLLWLKIYNFPLSQSNYNESRRVLETGAYFSNCPDWVLCFSCCCN